MLRYEMAEGRVHEVPLDFVRYRGRAHQIIAGLALGPDGVYFTPLMPDGEGKTPIYKVAYAAAVAEAHPYGLGTGGDARELLRAKGCVGCHTITGTVGTGSKVGPELDATLVPRLRERLAAKEYEEQVRFVDRLATEPHASYREARQRVLAAEGKERVRTWLQYYVREPQFDRQNVTMPSLGLTEAEARTITDYLMQLGGGPAAGAERGFFARALRRIAALGAGRLLFIFSCGFGTGVLALALVQFFRVRRRRAAGVAAR
jgi:hypothetical protein